MNQQIVVDTSALAAVVFGESDAERYRDVLDERAGDILIATATYVETTIVAEARRGPDGVRELRLLLREVAAEYVPVDSDTAELAVGAWRRFGKGRHSARLNLGDCFSYALAKQRDAPLLFKGDDFTQTDIASVLD